VRAPELLHGLRVVAKPAAIDAVVLPAGATVLRIAPDDAIVTGAAALTVDDPFAIVEAEHAFVHWRLTPAEFEDVAHHIEWPLPTEGQLGQGSIAGVPAKIMISSDDVLLVVSAGLAHEMSERLW
jgi:non-ribosomal peptide synthetase component F